LKIYYQSIDRKSVSLCTFATAVCDQNNAEHVLVV